MINKTGRKIVNTIVTFIFLSIALFGLALVFGIGIDLNPSDTPEIIIDQQESEQQALVNNLITNRDIVMEQVIVPDPEPVAVEERDYPAQRILNLRNREPITLEQAQADYRLALELQRQQEETLEALDIEPPAPEGRYFLRNLETLGGVNADAFMAGDLDTGEIIFERRANESFAIASVTKMFTAFATAKHLNPNDSVVVTERRLQVEGNRGGFRIGDSFSVRELLYPLLLVSSNDAGEMLALHKNYQEFIADMNNIAVEYGLDSTAFRDPTGLSAGNVSTATDLFSFMQVLMQNYPQIVEISGLGNYQVRNYTWYNINRAANFSEFFGGKTGFTNAARQTSVGFYTITLNNGQEKNIGIVILQSNTRQQDTRNILDYLRNEVIYLNSDQVQSLYDGGEE